VSNVTNGLVVSGVGGVVSVQALGTAGSAVAAPGGSAAGGSLTPLEVIGIFAGIPLALFTLIVLLVLAPSFVKGAGRQADLAWDGQPEWFGARPDVAQATSPETSTEAAPVASPGSGQNSGEAPDSARGGTDRGDADRGGAGGRW
jgi:hypothetical protein